MSDFLRSEHFSEELHRRVFEVASHLIRSGKLEEARVRMHELGIPIGLQKYYIRTTLNPATRLSGRALRDFRLYGSPDDIQRLDEDRAAAAARQRAQ